MPLAIQLASLPGFCVLVFFLAHDSQAQETLARQLRWKFSTGDRLEIRIEQQSSIRTMVDRRQVDQSNRMELTIDWQVESVDDSGTAQIRQMITAIRAELTLPGARGPVTTVYDSAADPPRGDARLPGEGFSRILNQPVTVTMTARGEITNVDVPGETLESIRQMPGSIEGRQVFSLDSVREMFQSAGTEFPEAAIEPGQSWLVERDFSMGSAHQFTRETTYTLADAGDIDFDSRIAIQSSTGNDKNPDVEFQPWTIARQAAGGQIAFDWSAGRVTNSQSQMNLETETTYQGFAVSTSIDSQIKMTVTKPQ